MIITELKDEFYNTLKGKRVLIVSSTDLDSVAACKIIQHLLRTDSIQYTLVSVDGIDELKEHFLDFVNSIQVTILINCGGTIDLKELLNPPNTSTFFIIDSHRPIHILNIYDTSNQINIIWPPNETGEIPSFDDIFRPDEDSEGDDDDSMDDEAMDTDEEEDSEVGQKRKRVRQRYTPEEIARRREHRDWATKRQEILYEYSQYSYYSTPAALMLLELSWQLSRGEMEILWWSIIGLTDSFVMKRMERENYVAFANEIQAQVSRLSHSQSVPRESLKVTYENELTLYLYQHWNVYESLKMTPVSSCLFKCWSMKGEKKLHEYLADLGLPLAQVKQKYNAMDLAIKKDLKNIIMSKADRYSMEDIIVPSFYAQIGYRQKLNAYDAHLLCLAFCDAPGEEKSPAQKFTDALDCLDIQHTSRIEAGIVLAKNLLHATFQQVQAFVEANQVISIGSFLYASIPEGAIDAKYFSRPNALLMLAHYTLRACVSTPKLQKHSNLPLVLMAPIKRGFFIAAGIPPMSSHSMQNLFGRVFEQSAARFQDGISIDYFDPCVVQVSADIHSKFLEHLNNLLT